jgi:uncharacterized cupredoxin-like copper-binding protein
MNRLLIIAALAVSSSVAAAQGVTVTLAEWKITLSRDTVRAGAVTFHMTNNGSMNHEFYVRGPGVAKGTHEIPKDESASLTVTLTPGTYEVYCPLADGTHKLAGMTKTLVVVPATGSAPPKKPGV